MVRRARVPGYENVRGISRHEATRSLQWLLFWLCVYGQCIYTALQPQGTSKARLNEALRSRKKPSLTYTRIRSAVVKKYEAEQASTLMRPLVRLPLRQSIRSLHAPPAHQRRAPERAALVVGVSLAVAGYAGWRIAGSNQHIALDALPKRQIPHFRYFDCINTRLASSLSQNPHPSLQVHVQKRRKRMLLLHQHQNVPQRPNPHGSMVQWRRKTHDNPRGT
jgi:hypothetical protein